MFTGIIQAVGQIEKITPIEKDVRLTIAANQLNMGDVGLGDSIAVNGVCLTVINFSKTHFEVHVSKESLSCTVGLNLLHAVNLEKALLFSDRIGGHLVTGHVDGVGTVTQFEKAGDCVILSVKAPHELSRLIATKGSITIDGVSLTVNNIAQDTFSVNLIPHTLACTTFQHFSVGRLVNLEVDLIARYVDRVKEWIAEGLTP